MLLDEQQIVEAKQRAEQVVGGFARIRDQQARDAVNLAETLQLRNKQLIALMDKVEKLRTAKDVFGSNSTFDDVFGKDNLFSDIFGKDMFGGGFGKSGFGRKK